MVITIDGPAGVGKSTTAKILASQLGYVYLDTGALYRALAWKADAMRVDPLHHEAIEKLVLTTTLQLTSSNHNFSILVDSRDVTRELRTPTISRLASSLAVMPKVREWLLPIQQAFGRDGGVVAEGRDMGTQVFPHAEVKFFLDAQLDVRASRRYEEGQPGHEKMEWNEVREGILERDTRDSKREVAPLLPAADAVLIDTSQMSVDQVVNHMKEVIAARL